MNRGLFTSHSDEWATPQEFFDRLNLVFHFDLDPCSTARNAKCLRFFTRTEDGLSRDSTGTVFMNPPYGHQIRHWVRKAYESSLAGATVVCLLPARTDTSWFHEFCLRGRIEFIRGRLKFGNAKNSAPFPSMLVVFEPHHSGETEGTIQR